MDRKSDIPSARIFKRTANRAGVLLGVSLLTVSLSGCVLAPKAARAERQRLKAGGTVYVKPIEQRELPDLPAQPSWQDVLHRAFLANGELEAAYFEWAAAVHRIEQA